MISGSASKETAVAIVGIGCRFPGGVTDAASLWQLLNAETSGITEIPTNRIDLTHYYDERPATPGRMMTRWGGFVNGIESFDADFFGISPREAEFLDPQHRLLLETTWEALEDAGQDAHRLKGAPVGVFIGQWLSDFEALLFADPEAAAFYMTTGSGRYASSGRLSYVLGLRGPSLTLDTACSSSLVAVHLAVRSIKSGECELAIAGGVNVILQPQISIAYSQSLMMAPDGRCKFGDELGDGYVRSDGAGIVVLKSMRRALADGDRIYAMILGSATNNDGSSSGSMGTPSRLGQEELLRSAYRDADRAANEVGYIEAHGTGTRAGDPIELGALGAVLGEGRPKGQKAFVGSIKTNLGHTEGAAGIAGLIKTALILHHGRIPASLNCTTLNPAVDWASSPLKISLRNTPWVGEKRLAGVSAFGIAGSNAHVVLESVSPAESTSLTRTNGTSPTIPLLPLSARSESALRLLAGKVADRLAAPDAPEIADLLRFAQTRRTALQHRAAFLAVDAGELAIALKVYADGGEAIAEGVADPRREAKVALVFPGQGGQWVGMARTLLTEEPAFRESILRADAVIRREAGWSLVEQLALNEGDVGYLGDRIDVVQPTLGALAIAYADWMKSVGLTFDSVVGHSMGEAAAAHVAGALSLEDALRILCRRSVLMSSQSGAGAMALVDLPAQDVAAELAGFAHKVSVAAINSRRSTVISGEKEIVTTIVADLNNRGVFSRLINVDVASHSPQMEAPSQALRNELAKIAPRANTTPFASALLGTMLEGEALDAAYWARNLREPVQFAAALEGLTERGVEVFLELGPHPVLGPSIEQVELSSGRRPIVACCGRREDDERKQLVRAIATLWCAGAPIDFTRAAASPAKVIDFPLYPWMRRRHWVETADIARTNDSKVTNRSPRPEEREWMFQTLWRELPPLGPASAKAGTWLLIGADQSLAVALQGLNATVIQNAPLGDLEACLSKLGANDATNVLVFAPLGEAAAFLPLRVAQAVAPGVVARLWFVTCGAQSPGEPAVVNVDHAALCGAARVLSDERPELWGGLLDLPPAATAADLSAAAAWLLDPKGEDLAAVRDGRVYAPRLAAPTDTAGRWFEWRANCSYLLTGGLGDVGLAVARSMVEQGARRLILMSRSGLPARRTWSDIDPDSLIGKRVAAVRALESLGASIHCSAVDVADEVAVGAFLEDYKAEGWPPIRGVFHLAGVVDQRLIGETSQEQFEAAIAGKLRGAQVLDRLLTDLDQFVLFSSMTTIVPHSGIAAYVAANAGLEGLAFDRRARGQPAVAIAWGQWWPSALAERTIAEQAQQGISFFTAERGAGLMNWAIAQQVPVMVVAPINWQTYGVARAARNEPLLSELKPTIAAKDREGRASASLDVVEDIFATVRDAVARTLHFSIDEIDPNKEFGAMGLTSLLALELRNRLERALRRPLSATLAWNHPTVAGLAAYLSGADKPQPQPVRDEIRPGKNTEALAAEMTKMAELSDADALLALRRRRKDVRS